MPKIKLAELKGGSSVDPDASIEIDWPVLPRVGEIVALDDAGTTGRPVGEFVVTSVKHYHYWMTPDEDEVVVFIRDARGVSAADLPRVGKPW